MYIIILINIVSKDIKNMVAIIICEHKIELLNLILHIYLFDSTRNFNLHFIELFDNIN